LRARAVAVAAAFVAIGLAPRAHAEDTKTVAVHVTAPGPLVLRGVGPLADVRATCNAPCSLSLIPGEYKYSGPGRRDEAVAFTGPSRLDLVAASEPLHTASLVVAGVGVLAVVGPLIAVLGTCSSRTDALGRPTESRCLDFGEGVDLGLTIVAGAGLTLVALGGIMYVLTGGGLSVTDLPTDEARPLGETKRTKAAPFQLDMARGQLLF